MDSDNDMEVDAVMPSASKGKAKAVDIIADGDTLPWYVHRCARLELRTLIGCTCRVEKYRPVTLSDVVSHKDITTTSAHRL